MPKKANNIVSHTLADRLSPEDINYLKELSALRSCEKTLNKDGLLSHYLELKMLDIVNSEWRKDVVPSQPKVIPNPQPARPIPVLRQVEEKKE